MLAPARIEPVVSHLRYKVIGANSALCDSGLFVGGYFAALPRCPVDFDSLLDVLEIRQLIPTLRFADDHPLQPNPTRGGRVIADCGDGFVLVHLHTALCVFAMHPAVGDATDVPHFLLTGNQSRNLPQDAHVLLRLLDRLTGEYAVVGGLDAVDLAALQDKIAAVHGCNDPFVRAALRLNREGMAFYGYGTPAAKMNIATRYLAEVVRRREQFAVRVAAVDYSPSGSRAGAAFRYSQRGAAYVPPAIVVPVLQADIVLDAFVPRVAPDWRAALTLVQRADGLWTTYHYVTKYAAGQVADEEEALDDVANRFRWALPGFAHKFNVFFGGDRVAIVSFIADRDDMPQLVRAAVNGATSSNAIM